MKRRILAVMLAVVFALPVLAGAQQSPKEATEVVKTHVDEVLKVLRNPEFKGQKGEQEKRTQIRAVADKLFDWVELSKRTLGLGWNRFSMEQRKEFVSLYKNLLSDTYMDRITAYTNEKVEFTDAVPLGGNAMEVRSTVISKTGKVPIYYRVLNESGQWKVYDVVIEGVSLIDNYRSQFREILANQSPDALLQTLRKKAGEKP